MNLPSSCQPFARIFLILAVTWLTTLSARTADQAINTHTPTTLDSSAPAPKIKIEAAETTNLDNDHLANAVSDTIAALMSVKVKLGWNNYHGPDLPGVPDDASSGQVQMVIPFTIFNQANLMRITTPYQIDGRGDNGFQRATIFDLLGSRTSWGR